ncbi:MAG: hypothetical protein KDD43_11445 [Bdellovibrionales bacterium]|nr:hypothetical protein [Bdellovibrionales bacterium]
MGRAKKRLDSALRKTDELPDGWFGEVEASVEDLPSVKRKRVRKNIFIDVETAAALDYFCEKHQVTFTDIANDILTNFVRREKRKKRA